MGDDPHARIKADLANAESEDDVAFVLDEQSCLRLANAIPPKWWAEHGGQWDDALFDYIEEVRQERDGFRAELIATKIAVRQALGGDVP